VSLLRIPFFCKFLSVTILLLKGSKGPAVKKLTLYKVTKDFIMLIIPKIVLDFCPFAVFLVRRLRFVSDQVVFVCFSWNFLLVFF